MHVRRSINLFFVLSLIIVSGMGVYAQPESGRVEPSYEVSLQLIVGSNDGAARSEIPAALGGISRQIRKSFSFDNYRLAGTFLGRITNTGNFEYKSTTNMFGQETVKARPTFLDWSLAELRSAPTAKGQQGYQARLFRFGARVPVTTTTIMESGRSNPAVSYESIGLNLGRVSLVDNSPTLIGTLDLPGADGTVFLVMTIKPADM